MLFALSPAQAQQAPTPTRLGEVVVTAQKRGEESVQDVPLSIQAFGTEKLEELNIVDFDDYVKYLPSVSYQSFGPGYAFVYMRGVASGGDGNHSGSLPSVGIYLDELPITNIQGALDIHLYDIQRVEALAGPQGTLYGASSQSGTLRIITNKPDPRAFSAGYGVEGNYNTKGDPGYLAEGYVNVPLSENAAIRLVGWARHDGGYIDNIAGTRVWPACDAATGGGVADCGLDSSALAEQDFNDVDTYGGRAALKIDLNDRWTVTPTVMAQKQEANGVFGFDPSIGEFKVRRFYPDTSKDEWAQAALTVEGKIGNLDVTYAGAHLDRDVETQADYSDYSYFYDYFGSYSLYITDDNGNPTVGQYIQGRDKYKKYTHELRIATPADRRLRFVGGLFSQRQDHDIQQRYLVDDLAAAYEVTGWADTIWLTKQRRVDRDEAAFGELSFDFTDKLTGTAGIRFFEADNSLDGFFGYGDWGWSSTGEAQCQPGQPVFRGAPCHYLSKSTKEDDSTHKLSLSYDFDDDRMMYVTWAEGFRPGGINRRGTLPPYRADFLTSYEIGWKTVWADGRLRWNGAVFHQEWEDFQFSLLGQNGLTEIKNAAEAEIQGIEMDISWALTDNFTVSAGFAWIDSELTKPYCGFVNPATQIPVAVDPCPDFFDRDDDGSTTDTVPPEAPAGTELPVTPNFKANLTLRQDFTIGTAAAWWRASLVHKGESRADLRDLENSILTDQPGYEIVDFSAGLDLDEHSFEFYVNNVFDERALQYRFVQCAETICGAQPYLLVTPPTTLGLRYSRKF